MSEFAKRGKAFGDAAFAEAELQEYAVTVVTAFIQVGDVSVSAKDENAALVAAASLLEERGELTDSHEVVSSWSKPVMASRISNGR